MPVGASSAAACLLFLFLPTRCGSPSISHSANFPPDTLPARPLTGHVNLTYTRAARQFATLDAPVGGANEMKVPVLPPTHAQTQLGGGAPRKGFFSGSPGITLPLVVADAQRKEKDPS